MRTDFVIRRARGLAQARAGCASLVLLLLATLVSSGCAKEAETAAAGGNTCTDLSGSAWVPNVSGVSAANRDSNVVVTTETYTPSSAVVTGLGDGYSGREITVTIPMNEDLGAYGSITLNAEVISYSSSLQGNGYPILTSFNDGTDEWVNLAAICASSGLFSCSGSSCAERASCAPQAPSAFVDRGHYEQNQIAYFGYTSVNTFPNCDWSGGSAGSSTAPNCGTQGFLSSGKLKFGSVGTPRNYVAKFAVLATNYASIPNNSQYSASIKVTVVKKKDTTAGGALDVNVILVGNNNVQASRTAKGQQNLDLLMKSFHDILNQTSSTIKLGAINAIEWPCAEGGDAYANVDLADLGTMITAGSSMVSASSQGRALNVYLVSTIGDSGSGSGLTILGIAGGIPGPFLNGKENSGLAFSSFNKLDTYNPNCTLSSCPTTSQEKSFIDMGATIAHEAGHYLGLNHLSESSGDVHDPVYDTPFCTTKSTTLDYITATSCSNESTAQPPSSDVCKTQCEAANGGLSYSPTNNRYCSAVAACGFNHLMWWLAKRTTPELSLGDGNVISTQSSSVLNRSPFIQ